MFILNKESLTVEISEPGSDYRGTRFDWSGVFHRIVKDGYVFVDGWSDVEDIHVHDHVRGPSEEFVTVDFYGVEPGSVFVKPGVGLLMRPDVKPMTGSAYILSWTKVIVMWRNMTVEYCSVMSLTGGIPMKR